MCFWRNDKNCFRMIIKYTICFSRYDYILPDLISSFIEGAKDGVAPFTSLEHRSYWMNVIWRVTSKILILKILKLNSSYDNLLHSHIIFYSSCILKWQVFCWWCVKYRKTLESCSMPPASILRKSTSGRHRPVSYPDGPMTARYRFT